MKKIIIILVIVTFSCNGPKNQTENSIDSTVVDVDSISQTQVVDTKAPNPAPPQMVFGVPVNDLLEKIQFPKQSCLTDEPSDSIAYSILSSQVVEGNYTDVKAACVYAGTKIFSVQYQPNEIRLDGGQEVDIGDLVYYNQYSFYSVALQEGSAAITNILTGGASCAHYGFEASITDAYQLAEGCQTMAIEYTTEGGNELPWKKKNLAFFLLDNGEFKNVLSVDLEDTFTMMNFGGGPHHPIEQLYEIEILGSKTFDLQDVKVTSQSTSSYEIYRFDGIQYTSK